MHSKGELIKYINYQDQVAVNEIYVSIQKSNSASEVGSRLKIPKDNDRLFAILP